MQTKAPADTLPRLRRWVVQFARRSTRADERGFEGGVRDEGVEDAWRNDAREARSFFIAT